MWMVRWARGIVPPRQAELVGWCTSASMERQQGLQERVPFAALEERGAKACGEGNALDEVFPPLGFNAFLHRGQY